MNTSNTVSDMWCWGRMIVAPQVNDNSGPKNSGSNDLPIPGGTFRSSRVGINNIDFTYTVATAGPWMMGFKQIVQSWNAHRGFLNHEPVRIAEVKGMLRIFFDPLSSKWLLNEYQIPVIRDDGHGTSDTNKPGAYVSTLGDFQHGFLEWATAAGCAGAFHFRSNYWWCDNSRLSSTFTLEGYVNIARAQVASWAGISTTAISDGSTLTGDAAWAFINSLEANAVNQPWSNDPRFAIVPYVATPPAGALIASPGELNYECVVSDHEPEGQSVNIAATGVVLDNWSAVNNTSWLSLSPASGTSIGPMTASVSCSGLHPGVYTDAITITSTTSGIAAPIQVAVNLTVSVPAAPPSDPGPGADPAASTTVLSRSPGRPTLPEK
jgi:hypothetical protein